ncbi:sensor histidine kinase [Pelagibius litoralis]|uniref:histidine kinase n=1 Tax=Pelagibius litoralis TaxID=374515 RepID=A0A967K7T7_9PROT|nr:sensor histidine kinase [Pelagibius litoralis]NIA70033.1 sensor histidine kinase [Pelagibius litoralis]
MTLKREPSSLSGTTWSLRRRLLGQLLLVFAGLAVLLYLSVQAVAGRAADATQDNILGASAIAIAEQVRVVEGAVAVDLPYAALEMLGLAGEDRVFYRIAGGGGALITGYDDLPSGELPKSEDTPLFFTAQYRGDTVRVATTRRSILSGGSRQTILITVAQTREAHGALTTSIALSAAGVGGGFLALAGLLAWIAISRTLKPVHEIERALAARASDDFSALETAAPREILPLIDAINDFVERLRLTLDTSQQFIAEAAHRIRTPLAALKAQAEVSLKAGPEKTSEESLRRMLRAADETSQLTTQLLAQAMVAYRAERAERQRLSLANLARTAVRDLEVAAEMRGIDFRMDLTEDVEIQGDEIALLEAIRNLLDNAIKYGPPDDFVQVCVPTGPAPEICIIDHGPGVPRKDRDLVFERFRRGSVEPQTAGSGLGLSIVRQVMLSHRGRVRLENNEPQGLKVRLIFPPIRAAGKTTRPET